MPATTTTMVRSVWQNYFYAMDGAEKAAAAEAAAAEEAANKQVAEEVEDDPLDEDLQVGSQGSSNNAAEFRIVGRQRAGQWERNTLP